MSLRSLLLYVVIGLLFWAVRVLYENMIGLRMTVRFRTPVLYVIGFVCGIALAVAIWPAIAPVWIWAVCTHKEKRQ